MAIRKCLTASRIYSRSSTIARASAISNADNQPTGPLSRRDSRYIGKTASPTTHVRRHMIGGGSLFTTYNKDDIFQISVGPAIPIDIDRLMYSDSDNVILFGWPSCWMFGFTLYQNDGVLPAALPLSHSQLVYPVFLTKLGIGRPSFDRFNQNGQAEFPVLPAIDKSQRGFLIEKKCSTWPSQLESKEKRDIDPAVTEER